MAFNQFVDPWKIPGWTVQNPIDILIEDEYLFAPFPKELKTVRITGEFYTSGRRPMSGYLSFEPSATISYPDDSGNNFSIYPRITKKYLHNGNLEVELVATDNDDVTPESFTYHVIEKFMGGQEYSIEVPKDSSDRIDIHDLIITEQ